jgi:S1-C subfamily serine protease
MGRGMKALSILLVLALISASNAWGEIYKYVDKDGQVRFSAEYVPGAKLLVIPQSPENALVGNALTPSQVFDAVKDSVVVIKSLDATGEGEAQGSGVILPSGKIATNCHVLKNGVSFLAGRGKNLVPATFYAGDADKYICLLDAKGISGKPANLGKAGSLKVGEPVYAVGAPKGLELSLSDGIVSQLRGGTPPNIQTTAAISPGSSGGGLFNSKAQLVGFITFYVVDGQSLNFAMPVEWLSDIAPNKKTAQRGLADTPVTRTAFKNPADGAAWLKEMSRRIAKRMPDEAERLEFLTTLHWEASRAGVDPQLMLGLIQVASGFKKYAVSPDGARGYMQVKPFWVESIGNPDHNLFQLRTNLRYGALILRHYIDAEKGDLNLALGRYGSHRGDPEFPNLVVGAWKRYWDYPG